MTTAIRHRIGIDAPKATVHPARTTLLDGGEAAPFPRDVHISSWD